MRARVRTLLLDLMEECRRDGVLTSQDPPFAVEYPANPEHGDFATNLAMLLARGEKKAPRAIADILAERLTRKSELFSRVEVAGPGFINFTINPNVWRSLLPEIAAAGDDFGRSSIGAGRKVQVEFVSANPTGPLHIGHGRGAAVGDAVSRMLEACGWDVTREFYYNDAGQQVVNLTRSVQARCLGIGTEDPRWPADGYQGEYIMDVAKGYLAGETVDTDDRHATAARDPENLEAIRDFAVAYLRREQDADLAAFDVHFDHYFLESGLYTAGKVDDVVQKLTERGHVYEQDGALWLRTTDFGDDKDRVMRKSDGNYTYFVPDVAYHLNKWERGFERVINEQGADHHSTVTRVRAGLQALETGIPKGWPEYVLHQMVTVMRGGEEVKISKRAGSYVTLRDLIDEVGRDATRYFFLMRKPDSQLVFDIDLAKQQSLDNPVYYVQYAHARICSIFENAEAKGFGLPEGQPDFSLLTTAEEMNMIKTVSTLPELVEASASSCEPHRITHYLQDLAGQFHSFYNRSRVIGDDRATTEARLFLLHCVRIALRNGLRMLGISAPEKM